ncbi:zinc-binding dehydrogenase domain-containing protein [Trichoderma breve]|uniref:Zinc-binding dehydrogenase domain-containing protein n=1 Tax=Trichoderma breve TaxID=2034170 RepID=A0A9W9EFI0_9HYPO|nr:zinc-binding dehydrogenase domain-containing protein [Trichoderma breve]KAJ4865671.1 zinc-binding dehydrogenase domain-containing protein [Trichoderma breve]
MTVRSTLVGKDVGQYELVHGVPVPQAGPDQVVCKVGAIALNPTDWKMVDFSVVPGAVGGHDFAGEVIEVGEGVTRLKKGDRVLGLAIGFNADDMRMGAFTDYAVTYAHGAWKIPDWMSYDEAATYGVGIGTATLALYQTLALPPPVVDDDGKVTAKKQKKPIYVLIAGGATATGTIAIQLAKASGLTVVTTCSPQHKDLLLSLGATAIFDYNSPNCAIEIRNYTDDSLQYALDCVTEAGTMKMCYDAIGSAGGRYVGLEPLATHIQYTRRTVRADWVIGRTLSGLPVRLDGAYGRPARPQDREFAEVFFALSEQLIAQGMLKPHPRELRTGGLEALVEGIDDLRKGKVRGKKLVYPLA